MALTREQLHAVIYDAFPGSALRESRQLGVAHYALALADGARLSLYLYNALTDARNAAAALGMLRDESDLPIPLLHAAATDSNLIGQPYLLTSQISGETLGAVLPRLTDNQLYDLGTRLGEIASRVHRLAAAGYGPLGHDTGAADERTYGLQRAERELAACGALGLLNQAARAEVRYWFAHNFPQVGRAPALLHGILGPRTILLRADAAGWQISGIVGWHGALGWSPAWEHAAFLDAVDSASYFGMRVGYGDGYDAQTRRSSEQVREHTLVPYRVLLALQRMRESHEAAAYADSARYRAALLGRVRALVPL